MSALCLILLAAAQPAPCVAPPAWRAVATDLDRARLRDWRETWQQAQLEAKAAGKPLPAGTAYDLDQALDRPVPPAGAYRCRLVKLGGAAGVVDREWGRCRVDADGLAKLDGPQRPVGQLYTDATNRGVFLGTLALGDETRPLAHGRDDDRDLAGWVERVSDTHWRVVLPRPRFESTLDLLELEPGQ